MKKIMLVPLDDRPCCTVFPADMGKMVGVEIIQPPSELLGRFMVPGDGVSIGEWMLQNAEYVDGFIISCDMLAYGGLIASRDVNTSLDDALDRLQVIKKIRSIYPNKPVYAQSVLMRISITSKNKEYTKYWADIIRYSVLVDKVERMGMSELKKEWEEIRSQIPEEILQNYLVARRRNHKINLEMIKWVKEEIIDFLIITQEDCAEFGLHVREQDILIESLYQYKIMERVIIYPGADEGTQTLLLRMVLKSKNHKLRLYPIFCHTNGESIISTFEDRSIGETLKGHIYAIGGTVVNDINDADIVIMLNTPMDNQGPYVRRQKGGYVSSRHNLWSFIDKMNYLLKTKDLPVAVADVCFPNASDSALIEYMFQAVELPSLYGYAGWNTTGNTIGTTLSLSGARWYLEQYGDEEGLKNFIEFLIGRFLDEWGYQGNARQDLYHYIQEDLKVSPMDVEEQYEAANLKLKELMMPYCERVEQVFQDREILHRKEGYRIGQISIQVDLPWNRAFECRVEVEVGLWNI